MNRSFKGFTRYCCMAVISSLVCNCLAAQAGAHYYYQNAQISAINQIQTQTSFLLMGRDRLVALPLNDGVIKLSQLGDSIFRPLYFLGDGKSQNMQVDDTVLLTAKSWGDQNAYHAMDYLAYGSKTEKHQPNDQIVFGYNGEYQDPNTRLVYLRARDYDAASQRFMTMDSYPLLNRYASFSADPISHIDPSGHSVEQWLKKNENWLIPTGIGLLLAIGGGISAVRYNRNSVRRLELAKANIRRAFDADVRERDSFFSRVLGYESDSGSIEFPSNDASGNSAPYTVNITTHHEQAILAYQQAAVRAFNAEVPQLKGSLTEAYRAYNSVEGNFTEVSGEGWHYRGGLGNASDEYYGHLGNVRDILSSHALSPNQQVVLAHFVGDYEQFDRNLSGIFSHSNPTNPDTFYAQYLHNFRLVGDAI